MYVIEASDRLSFSIVFKESNRIHILTQSRKSVFIEQKNYQFSAQD